MRSSARTGRRGHIPGILGSELARPVRFLEPDRQMGTNCKHCIAGGLEPRTTRTPPKVHADIKCQIRIFTPLLQQGAFMTQSLTEPAPKSCRHFTVFDSVRHRSGPAVWSKAECPRPGPTSALLACSASGHRRQSFRPELITTQQTAWACTVHVTVCVSRAHT